MIYYIDHTLYNYFKESHARVVISSESSDFDEVARRYTGETVVPFVAFNRSSDDFWNEMGNVPVASRGQIQRFSELKTDVGMMKAIPMKFNYTVRFYCHRMEELLAFMRTTIFYFHRSSIPINLILANGSVEKHNVATRIEASEEDRSPFEETREKGKYFKLNISSLIFDAYLIDEESRRTVLKVIVQERDFYTEVLLGSVTVEA